MSRSVSYVLTDIIPVGSEEGKQLDKLYALDRHIRGSYILQANWIENLITEGIAQHFCPNDPERKNFMISLVLKEIFFSPKINIYLNLIELEYPKANVKLKEFRKRLEEIRNLRNRLAHAVLDTSDDFLNKKQTDRIRLQYYKDGKKEFQEITTGEIDSFLGDTTAVMLIILDINKHITENPKKSTS